MFKSLFKSLCLLEFRSLYKIKTKLGEGGFGSVHLVSRKKDNLLLAAKKIEKSQISHFVETKDGAVLPLEVHCLGKLQHPNIVNTLSYMETKFHCIILMEYSSTSCDLFEYINARKRLSERLARDIFLQIYTGVTYCLARGVDHRDIKDENILIDLATNRVKLIDFGSASLHEPETPYTVGRGTMIFLPAEFFSTGKYYAEDATVWALGCLVYKMVMGYHPFLSRKEILDYEPRVSKKVGPSCNNFLRLCLRKRPEERLVFGEMCGQHWFSKEEAMI